MSLLAVQEGPIQYLGEFVFGVVVVLGLFGWIWFKPAVDRLLKDKDKVEAQRDSLIEVHENTTLPVLKDVNDKVIPALQDLAKGLEDLTAEVTLLRDQRRNQQ